MPTDHQVNEAAPAQREQKFGMIATALIVVALFVIAYLGMR